MCREIDAKTNPFISHVQGRITVATFRTKMIVLRVVSLANIIAYQEVVFPERNCVMALSIAPMPPTKMAAIGPQHQDRQ